MRAAPGESIDDPPADDEYEYVVRQIMISTRDLLSGLSRRGRTVLSARSASTARRNPCARLGNGSVSSANAAGRSRTIARQTPAAGIGETNPDRRGRPVAGARACPGEHP